MPPKQFKRRGPKWFKKRGYRHFDRPVGHAFVKKAMDRSFVEKHAFSPLIHYTKSETRYKKCPKSRTRSISTKDRPIKYASHRDACILAFYADLLNKRLDGHYAISGFGDSVIAYRSLGKSNYDFAAEAVAFANANSPATILAFDVTNFFDTLDHALLKKRLKSVLGVDELSPDWYQVFRFITRFHFIEMEDLREHPVFGPRLKQKGLTQIASVEELKQAGVPFRPNPEISRKRGIPQGTPISAAASNLYMLDFDKAAREFCDNLGALYRRYSDDILVICKPQDAAAVEAEVKRLLACEKLEISPHKTEITQFDRSVSGPRRKKPAQYLGFNLDENGPTIRENSLGRQWRKLRRAVRRAKQSAAWRARRGIPGKTFTKRLRKRFLVSMSTTAFPFVQFATSRPTHDEALRH